MGLRVFHWFTTIIKKKLLTLTHNKTICVKRPIDRSKKCYITPHGGDNGNYWLEFDDKIIRSRNYINSSYFLQNICNAPTAVYEKVIKVKLINIIARLTPNYCIFLRTRCLWAAVMKFLNLVFLEWTFVFFLNNDS